MKKVSKNFLSLFISDVASRIIGFFATVYIARLLATEGFGQISYGLAFLSYALLFANPGLTTIGAREIAKEPGNRRIIEEILGLRLVLAVIIILLFVIGILVIPGQPVTKKIIFFYCLCLFPFAVLLEFVFQGKEKMEYIGFSRFFQYGVYVILLFILVKSSRNITMVPISLFFGYCAAAVLLFFIFLKKYGSIKFRFSMGYWRNLLAGSVPIGLATIFSQVSLSLPLIILGIFHSKTDVGLFSASFKIIIMLLIIDRVFYYVFFPIMTKQHARAPERLKRSFGFIVKALFAITIPLTCGGIIFGDKIIHFIYGTEYRTAITVFRILLLYFLVTPINTIFGYGLIAINQEKRYFRVVTITAILNIVLILILGINFKGPGAAAALFIAEMLSIILMNRELKKFVGFKTVKCLPKPILAALIMGVLLYALHQWHIVFLILVGLCVYCIAFYLIKGFSKEEFQRLGGIFTSK